MPSDKSVRSEITILGPDVPKAKPIGFTVRDYQGVEIHKYEEGRQYERDEDGRWKDLEPVTEEGALHAGDKILVHGLTGGLMLMTVEANSDGILHGVSGFLSARLEFGKDDRHAWVCTILVNIRGVEKLQLTTT
jgi:hypothetical protein